MENTTPPDGVGGIAKKPYSKWVRKGNHYWDKWQDEDKTAEPKPNGRPRESREAQNVEFTLDDIAAFLSDRITDPDGEKIPIKTLRQLFKILFGVVSDLLLEHAVVVVPEFAKMFVAYSVKKNQYYVITHAEEEMIERLSKTGKKLTFQTESVREAIAENRAARLAKNDKQLDVQHRYLERKKQENDNQNDNDE